MNEQSVEYLKTECNNIKIIRTEILFTPLLVVLPFVVGAFLIYDWFCRDFSMNELELTGELMLGVIILVGNVMFDVPFLKSLIGFRKK